MVKPFLNPLNLSNKTSDLCLLLPRFTASSFITYFFSKKAEELGHRAKRNSCYYIKKEVVFS